MTTHVWFAAQAALLVVVAPHAFLRLRLTPLELGLAYAAAGVAALVGATTSTAFGRRVGTGGAIIASRFAHALGVLVMLAASLVPDGWPAAAVLAAGHLVHGWGTGVTNSCCCSPRRSGTPARGEARRNAVGPCGSASVG